jgi:hypothetical protein
VKSIDFCAHNGGIEVVTFPGGKRGRADALGRAVAYVRGHTPCGEGASVRVIERARADGPGHTVIEWTPMREHGHLFWVLATAGGMAVGECARHGIDWKAERDRRLRLGGAW